MANSYKKISELNTITSVDKNNDLLAIVDGSQSITKKISVANLVGVGSAQTYILDYNTNCSVGDGVFYFRVPAKYDNCKLVDVAAACIIAGITGIMTIQIRNITTGHDLLSTLINIDSTKIDSEDSVIQPIINPLYATVSESDQLRIDIKTIHTTPAKGLIVDMSFL